MRSKFFLKQRQKFLNKTYNNEDYRVIEFLKGLEKKAAFNYLEVGSGLGRFPLKLKGILNNLKIECLKINPELAKTTKNKGLKTTIGNAVELPYKNNSFDILHCAHVIEHITYPDVSNFLDEIIRVVRNNGYIIIRSPLMNPDFYFDIDHVRPYPPEAIFNYFNNPQQQKNGEGDIKTIKCWYIRENFKISNIISSKIKFLINMILAYLWLHIGFPRSKKRGYILIMQNIKNNA